MEFGTREILILLGIVILLGILLDGIRRVRQARNGSLRVARRKPAIFDDESYDDLPGELPTGEVRVTKRDEQSVEQVSDNIRKYRERNTDKCTSIFLDAGKNANTVFHDQNGDSVSVEPSLPADIQVATNQLPADDDTTFGSAPEEGIDAETAITDSDLDHQADQYIDTSAEHSETDFSVSAGSATGGSKIESSASLEHDRDQSGIDNGREVGADQDIKVSLDEFSVEEDTENAFAEEQIHQERKEPTWDMVEPEQTQPVGEGKSAPFVVEPDPEKLRAKPGRKPFWESSEPGTSVTNREASNPETPDFADSTAEMPSQVAQPPRAQREETSTGKSANKDISDQSSSRPDELQVVVMHIMAKKDNLFDGNRLLESLLANGLRFGDMGIFHRHQYEDGSGPVHFSVANSVKPGTFNLEAMDDFTTPGITMFMNLEGLSNALDSYAVMIKAAQAIAKALQGELKDENRSALTKQTIEHYRQQIIEYTRRSFTLSS